MGNDKPTVVVKRLNNKGLLHKMVNSDHIVFTFMRSTIASLSSAVTDLGSRILFFSVILSSMPEFYRSNLSVAIGAVIGGIVNCAINYKFTFHASGQSIVGVAVKFSICWLGNLLLNMYGTTLTMMMITRWGLLKEYGITEDQIFAATTFGVAVIVSVCWNFTIQRYFVYRITWFDRMLGLNHQK